MGDLTLLVQQVINGVALGSLYGIFAMGFGIVFATMNILSVAHGTLATWGAIVAWAAVTFLGLPFAIGMILAVAAVGVLAVIMDQVGFQPLRERGEDGFFGVIISSIGFWIVYGNLALIATNASYKAFPVGSFPRDYYSFAGLTVPVFHLATVAIAVVVAFGLYVLVHRTNVGAAMRAVGADMQSAALSGIDPRKVIVATSFLAAAVVGLAGVVTAATTNNVSYVLGEGLLLKGFAAVVVGGLGDVRGGLLGGLVLGLSEVLTAQYVSSSMRDAVSFGVLILFLLYRPRGILGTSEFTLKL